MQCREIAANAMGQLCALRPCVDLVESAINDRLTSTSLVYKFCLSVCQYCHGTPFSVRRTNDQLCRRFPACGN